MNTINIPIILIENNTGQVPGLPPNPRFINQSKLDKLIESIKQDPEMLKLRSLLIYPIDGGKYITIGGNMRLIALNRLGFIDVPCIIIPKDTSVEKLRNYIIKDNGNFGDWDYQALFASWDSYELQEWAIDIPEFQVTQEERKRAGWGTSKDSKEGVCDMEEVISYHNKRDFAYISCFKKSEQGFPLSQIKSDLVYNVQVFANSAINVIRRTIGVKQTASWAITTTPKRRHKENNFAESVCDVIASKLNIKFYKNAVSSKNRQRINPTFEKLIDIHESNLIIFDDILTTGSTLDAMNRLFHDKNCFFVIGINNN